ncbi:uncharacterized protein LOC114353120 [Ostrinia furnacalis]|uniref:uncharacterized protein LOC114353120 n=1 Tax=Ostrinia furnacalis TaxID=93504 RepID=UPI00103F1C97|nr:uncharacterized protein LOC114353120 [Ostrinia furnacalis]
MPNYGKERRKSRQDDYEDCAEDSIPHNPTHMLQMTAELVPRYSGRDSTYPVTRWVEDVESNAEIFGWSPLQQLLVARRSLTGTAQLWLRAERPFKSWDDLKAAITKEFPDTVDVKAIHELMSARKRRVDETCLDYMLIMKELGKRGKMPDYVAIKYIVDGIVDIETNKMMLYGVTTYSDLKEKLKIYETIVSKMQKSSVPRNEAESSKQQQGRQGHRRIRCYGCGDVGHASANCPHKNKGLKCFKCNEFGHVGSTCTQVTKNPAVVKYRESSGNFGKARQGYQQQNAISAKRAMFGTVSSDAANFTPADDGGAPGGRTVNDESKMASVVYGSHNDSDSDDLSVSEVMQVVNKHCKSLK